MLIYFLIIGGFLALLMFIRSRIKKAAAEAFEREIIEEEEFTLTKPEGFLTPVDRLFEAYSKEFVEGGRQRKSWAKMSIFNKIERNSQKTYETTEDGLEILVFEKLISSKKRQKSYKLEVFVVKEAKEEYLEKINEMLESFRIKEV